jgi:hypothetical protein
MKRPDKSGVPRRRSKPCDIADRSCVYQHTTSRVCLFCANTFHLQCHSALYGEPDPAAGDRKSRIWCGLCEKGSDVLKKKHFGPSEGTCFGLLR